MIVVWPSAAKKRASGPIAAKPAGQQREIAVKWPGNNAASRQIRIKGQHEGVGQGCIKGAYANCERKQRRWPTPSHLRHLHTLTPTAKINEDMVNGACIERGDV